ncbi:restriction endonuclease, SacI family [Oculatella sp. FACHB-28]|uniref:restriction endonuclease, SacI family n=1 Tax=Oculatella sp. FACHB-28 TaxID=2692845 RepID=UPI0016879EC0|nr:restriction endonuclease, SacI family [Oculatella sp. FACHB-28]MBD2058134.1 restriction endonuclease, SacI family [Oculatella sp. FACHB-28]
MCGNFGFLGKRVLEDGQELLPARVVEAFNQMGRETEIRGEQAGGGLTLARDKNNQITFVGEKVLNRKRNNLTQSLEDAFELVRHEATSKGTKPLESVVIGVWHYRYGTSSPPAILETHWHEWMPARNAIVWQIKDGEWIRSIKNVNHRITHNGDLDTFQIFGKQIDNANLGLWLERVLHTPNFTTGDSPKISGLMDLLITQGMWDASLKLAYQLEVAGSIEAAFGGRKPAKHAPNTAPSQQELSRWAEIYEEIWQKHNDAEILFHKEYLSHLEAQLLKASKDILPSQRSKEEQTAFVRAAIDAFLHNDLYRATRIFMSRAEGSFGLVTVSTLSEESLVLSSQGQPMTIGFNLPEAYMVYASEPAAVNSVLVGMPNSYRLDLDQEAGEVALVGTNSVTVYSMAEGRELLESELEKRSMPMQNNPYIQLPKVETQDPVASDIQEIPQVLKAIEATWLNPRSCNSQSAEHLLSLLIEKVKRFDEKREKMLRTGLANELEQSQIVDFLITGIENSLWVGERFAQDLKTLFPHLNIKTLSANRVLRQLQYDLQSLNLSKDSIVLMISQSGQTFPTLHATHALDNLYRAGAISGLFILTGELNSRMGFAIAQSYVKGAAFSRRIFTNGSGQRTAEPATLTAAAAHQTLTELLLYLAHRVRQVFPDSSPLGMTLTEESLAILETIKADFLDRSVALITGTTARGMRLKSPENRKLIRTGRKWALHVTEVPLAWAIHAVYVLVVLGWTIPFGYIIPITQMILLLILLGLFFPHDLISRILTLLHPVLTLADIGIAIFGPWLWTLGLRYLQRRQLLARTGKRVLVIGDVPWVHQLLESYVSKLFSLSYGVASLDIHGANPQDHMLHQFGHRVTRGTLVLLGVPDGRRSQIQRCDEDAAIMTGKQSDGVRNTGTGPEVVALGHNPAIARKGFSDAIILRSRTNALLKETVPLEQQAVIEALTEARFSSFERLLASYVLFWALAKQVASFPLLKYQHWKSQSRTRVATTAAPVSGMNLGACLSNQATKQGSVTKTIGNE